MTEHRLNHGLHRLWHRFRKDERAVALVEAAFIFPVMILMYVGSVAVTMGVTTDRKVTLMTRTLGDIVAQSTTVRADEMNDVFNASTSVMYPYDTSNLRMRVSGVLVDGDTQTARVCWSQAESWTPRGAKDDITSEVPLALRSQDSFLIMPEVEYDYIPVVGADVTGGRIVLKDRLYMRPRQVNRVTHFSEGATPDPDCA
jgi:Flp pilus assembly protein TadG